MKIFNQPNKNTQSAFNNLGKITIRHRGGGHKQKYRKIDFHRKEDFTGIATNIKYDPNRNANFAAVYSSLTTKRLKTSTLGHCTRKRFYSGSAPCRMPLPFSYRAAINTPFQNTVPTPPPTPVEVQIAVVGTPQTVNSTIGSISPITDPSNAIHYRYRHDHGFGDVDYSDVVTQVIYNYSNTVTPSEMDILIYLTMSYL